MALTTTLLPGLAQNWFTVPGKGYFSPSNLKDWITLISHIAGHSGWSHLAGNFAIILLVGPMLEEGYGSLSLLVMILTTSLVTGILNVLFFPTGLTGASGVVFMMILLASFTNFRRGEIPLTFILVLILYLGNQLLESFNTGSISHFAHIAGGFCGSLFGFFGPSRRRY
jgi:membrane associated rhomboid family serine protease